MIRNAQSSQSTLIAFAVVLVAGAVVAVHSPGADAQPAKFSPVNVDDLRAAYANAADVAEGKRVAETNCFRCHGANGISSAAGIPHLAGQRPAYLHRELRAYQAGARGDNAMDGAVKFLSEDALIKVAAYYASIEPAQPGAGGAGKAPATRDPMQAGKAAASSCTGCHGETGVSSTPGMPNLVGLDPKYFVTAMQAYKNGQRKNEAMAPFAASLSDSDLGNLALYFALQKPARAKTPASGNAAAGKAAAAACSGCHGDNGVSASPVNPSMAGQDAQYLAAALRAYKSGARKEDAMSSLAAALDNKAIADIAAFYAMQQPQAPKVNKPLTVAEWAARCDRCHGVNGNSVDPRSPALAGQRFDYLEKALNAYRTGARKSPEMAAMADVLSETDVKNLAGHYSRQRARAFAYVVLPAK